MMPVTRAVATVDAYIAPFPPAVRAALRKVRAAARRGAPRAREVISYRMPALRQHGILVYFAAFKHHIGLFPPVSGDVRLERAASPYAGPKGNLRFPLDEPIPCGLIERLTRLRARQDAAKAAAPAAVNAGWHRAHRMPPRATPAERLKWHEAHATHCGCRPFTADMRARLRKAVAAKGSPKRA